MKKSFYINTILLIIFGLCVLGGIFWREKIMCYSTHTVYTIDGKELVEDINNGGCIIDQSHVRAFLSNFGIEKELSWRLLFFELSLVLGVITTTFFLFRKSNKYVLCGKCGGCLVGVGYIFIMSMILVLQSNEYILEIGWISALFYFLYWFYRERNFVYFAIFILSLLCYFAILILYSYYSDVSQVFFLILSVVSVPLGFIVSLFGYGILYYFLLVYFIRSFSGASKKYKSCL